VAEEAVAFQVVAGALNICFSGRLLRKFNGGTVP